MILFERMQANFPLFVLTLAILASAIAVVYTKHAGRTEFVALQKLEKQRDALNENWGRLLLEQSTWSGPGRIEQQAQSRLTMIVPTADMIVVIKP